MATLALTSVDGAPPIFTRSAVHKLALGLVWHAVALGAVVFSEPAPVDVLMMGLLVLLPVVGLVAMSRALIGMLALMLVAAAAAFVGTTRAIDTSGAAIHTAVSLYLYLGTFVLAAFVAKRPDVHARLILNAYTYAAFLAAAGGIVGYFDLLPGAHELLTRWSRATGFFKDPNVFGPFLVPGLVCALSRLADSKMRRSPLHLGLLLVFGFAILLSFSRGAWINLGVAIATFVILRVLTARQNRVRLKLLALVAAAAIGAFGLVVAALQSDAVADLFDERVALTQSYDEGPEGRFGGQQKAAHLAIENPLGIGAQQFAPYYHHEEPHNVYLALFLNGGWLGGIAFLALVGITTLLGLRHALVRGAAQPLFLVAYACFFGNVCEGMIIDIDHWRHFYLLMALVWGMMAASGVYSARAASSRRVSSLSGSA